MSEVAVKGGRQGIELWGVEARRSKVSSKGRSGRCRQGEPMGQAGPEGPGPAIKAAGWGCWSGASRFSGR